MSLRPRPTAPAPTDAVARTRLQHVLEAGLRAQELKEEPQVMDVGISSEDKKWCKGMKPTVKQAQADVDAAQKAVEVEESKTDKIKAFLDSAKKKGDVDRIEMLQKQLMQNYEAITVAKEKKQRLEFLRNDMIKEMRAKGPDCSKHLKHLK